MELRNRDTPLTVDVTFGYTLRSSKKMKTFKEFLSEDASDTKATITVMTPVVLQVTLETSR